MTSALENLFAMQLDAAGLTGYVREYQAVQGRALRHVPAGAYHALYSGRRAGGRHRV